MTDSHIIKLRLFTLGQRTIRINLSTINNNNGSGTSTPNYPDKTTTYAPTITYTPPSDGTWWPTPTTTGKYPQTTVTSTSRPSWPATGWTTRVPHSTTPTYRPNLSTTRRYPRTTTRHFFSKDIQSYSLTRNYEIGEELLTSKAKLVY